MLFSTSVFFCCSAQSQTWFAAEMCVMIRSWWEGVYLSSKNTSCWCCVCVIQQKWCLWRKVTLWLCVLLVWLKANKYKFEKHNKKDLSSNWTFPLRGMKSNYRVTVLKYSVLFDKNVYCVSLAKKKKKPALWHLNFYKGFLVPNKCKDLIYY